MVQIRAVQEKGAFTFGGPMTQAFEITRFSRRD